MAIEIPFSNFSYNLPMKKLTLLILATFTLFAKPHITLYNAYSNANKTYINGRLIEDRVPTADNNNSTFRNIINKSKLLFNSELKDTDVYVLNNGKTFKSRSDNEGYFNFNINSNADILVLYTNKEQEGVELEVVKFNNPKVGVISDFDDTLIISNVPHKLKLISNTITKNYKQRVLVKKTAKKIKNILKKHPKAPFIIVSGSPYQLYNPVKNFLNYHNFPKPIILLKRIHGDNKESNDQFRYKVAKIEQIFKQFPTTKWYMFGDSGEKDAEVYKFFKAKYPNRVVSFEIRKVK